MPTFYPVLGVVTTRVYLPLSGALRDTLNGLTAAGVGLLARKFYHLPPVAGAICGAPVLETAGGRE